MPARKILVTGGAGFIGSNLCRRLHGKGNEVTCLDNLYSGRAENIADLIGKPGFTFIRHDVVDPIPLSGKFDQIYAMACPASPLFYQKNPVHTTRTIVDGAINTLEVARICGARALLTSTSEIYGEPSVHPQREEYRGNVNTIGVRSCYDEGKRMAESLFFDYRRQYGADICVARIFNTYGPGMLYCDGRVIPNFINQALQGKDLTVYGDGNQTRSLCYVDDTVEALIRLMNASGFTGPVNIGNPDEITMRQLAETICRETGSRSKIVYCGLPEDDPTRRCPDISRAREYLGWEPVVPLHEGLLHTISYFAAQPSAFQSC